MDEYRDRLVKLFKETKRIMFHECPLHCHQKWKTIVQLTPSSKSIPGLINTAPTCIELYNLPTYSYVKLCTSNYKISAIEHFPQHFENIDDFYTKAANNVITWIEKGRCMECGLFLNNDEHECKSVNSAIVYNIPAEKCSICLENTVGVCSLSCGHRFHCACIQGIESQYDDFCPTCPVCRKKLIEHDTIVLFGKDYSEYVHQSDQDSDDDDVEMEDDDI